MLPSKQHAGGPELMAVTPAERSSAPPAHRKADRDKDPVGSYARTLTVAEVHLLPEEMRARLEKARRARMRPDFYSLPESLFFPIPELTLAVMFSASMLQSACAVIGAVMAGYTALPATLALSVCVVVVVVGTFCYEGWRILVFSRRHRKNVRSI